MSVIMERPCPLHGALSPQAITEGESDALWAMTPFERTEAMWNGALTLFQLREWSARAPRQVPILGGEFAWLMMRTPEYCETTHANRSRT